MFGSSGLFGSKPATTTTGTTGAGPFGTSSLFGGQQQQQPQQQQQQQPGQIGTGFGSSSLFGQNTQQSAQQQQPQQVSCSLHMSFPPAIQAQLCSKQMHLGNPPPNLCLARKARKTSSNNQHRLLRAVCKGAPSSPISRRIIRRSLRISSGSCCSMDSRQLAHLSTFIKQQKDKANGIDSSRIGGAIRQTSNDAQSGYRVGGRSHVVGCG